jgi:signal-transduction protein with cAMP-binding, CBS, and nucleotidyltransferase domain
MLISEFMAQNVITAAPDSLVLSAIKGFLDNQVHHLPITHEKNWSGLSADITWLKISLIMLVISL